MSFARALTVPVLSFLLVVALVSALAVGTAGPARAEETKGVRIHGGFVTGNQYRDMTGIQKRAYVAGLLDGMLLAPAFGGDELRMAWFLACTDRIGVIKLRAAINTYVRENPDSHDKKSAAHMYRAVRGACRALAKQAD